MKLRRLPQQHVPAVDEQIEQDHEQRLQDAENRANALLRTAEWIRSTVAARDEKNSWQASVNRLFLGEST